MNTGGITYLLVTWHCILGEYQEITKKHELQTDFKHITKVLVKLFVFDYWHKTYNVPKTLTRVQVIDRELSFGLSVCGPSAPVADHMLVMAGHRYSGLEPWDLG